MRGGDGDGGGGEGEGGEKQVSVVLRGYLRLEIEQKRDQLACPSEATSLKLYAPSRS
jgi:hypothetical protein